MTDVELIKACQAKNPKAQELLYNRYAGRLMGICMRYGAGKDEAQDIFQEAFIKVFENIQKVTQVDTLNAWVKKSLSIQPSITTTNIKNVIHNYLKVIPKLKQMMHTIELLTRLAKKSFCNLSNAYLRGISLYLTCMP
jgi:ribosomal protein S7